MVAWLSALVLAASAAAPGPRCVQIIGTNDLHGHIEPDVKEAKPLPPEQPAQKAITLEEGGLSGLAGYLRILREKYPRQTLLLDAGDLFQGTVPSNLSKGAAVIAAYNAIGYQAAALGNHEFDFGPADHENDLLGAIKKRVAEAKFPFLACNIYEVKTGERPRWKNLKASVTFVINGVKVGVIGAITPDTPSVTVPLNVASLEFRDPAGEVVKEAAKLRKQGAKIVVLVAHIGGDCAHVEDAHDLSSCNANSEMFKLVDRLPEGTLDVAIAGHTHKYIAQFVKGVAVIESGSYSHSFGWVQSCVDAQGKVKTDIHPPIDVCLQDWKEGGCQNRTTSEGTVPATFLGQPVKPDPAIAKTIQPFLDKVKAQQEAPTGITMAAPSNRRHDLPSSLGELVAEGIRSAVPKADVGLTNAGGVRADLPAGPLKFGQLFEVLPFDNRVVWMELTGAQLKDLLLAPLLAGHGFPQLAGAKLEFDRAHPEASTVTVAGAVVDPQKSYVLVTNDFLANGGDGTKKLMDSVAPAKRHETGLLVRDAFLSYLKGLPQPVQPPAEPGAAASR